MKSIRTLRKIRMIRALAGVGLVVCAASGCDDPGEGSRGGQGVEVGTEALGQEGVEQLWLTARRGASEGALRAAGLEVVGRRGPGVHVALRSPDRPIPPGFEVHRPLAAEKMDAGLRERLAGAGEREVVEVEALVLVEGAAQAEALLTRHGLKATGPLRFGGAIQARGVKASVEALAGDPRVRAALTISPEPVSWAPEGESVPMNAESRATSGVDGLHPDGDLGLGLTGRGLTLGLIDNGPVRLTHRDFGGRVSYRDGGDALAEHATHVSGTMIGAGVVRGEARGMAYEARLIAFNFSGDAVQKMADNGHTFTASNHSYGHNLGWFFDGQQWIWGGNRGFGKYDQGARRSDEVVYATDAIWLKAAGNDNGNGQGVADQARPVDCGSGFDCIATGSLAKNLIIVGAVHDLPGGPEAADQVRPTSFTSYGPADDGRIKPDLAANGQDLVSTGIADDESYLTFSGTSMATPTVTGIIGLLLEQYGRARGGATPTAAEVKAVLIQTARSPHGQGRPDHRLGFGLVDARGAARHVEAALQDPGRQVNDLVEQGARAWTFEASGEEEITLTLVWTDPPGEVNNGGVDDRTPALVNDLDLVLLPPGEAPVRYPWRLQADRPGETALRDGPNRRDNVEKIVVPRAEAAAGLWRAEVRMAAEPFGGRPQAFSLASSHSLLPAQEAPALLEVGRVVRLRLLESDAPIQVVLPITAPSGRPASFELEIDELPGWIALDRREGVAPGDVVTATVDPSGLSNDLYFAPFRVLNGTAPGAAPRLMTVELEVADSAIPRAIAGVDRVVPSGAHVQLVGSGSDPGGEPLSFAWRQAGGPEVVIAGQEQARASFDAPVVEGAEPVELLFELIVSDGLFLSQPDPVRVVVQPPFEGPGEPANNRCSTAPQVALPYTVDGELEAIHDVDFVAVALGVNERIEVETFGRGGETLDTTLGIVTPEGAVLVSNDDEGLGTFSRLTFTAAQAGVHCVAVSAFSDFVFDGSGGRAAGIFGLTIVGAGFNTAPVARAGEDQVASSGRLVRLDGRQSDDAQRDPLTFAWRQVEGPPVALVNSAQSLAIFQAPDVEAPTTLRFALSVGDGALTSEDEARVVVEPGFVVGAQPFAGPDRSVAEGARVRLDGEATNPDQVELGWRWVQRSGPPVSLSRFDRPTVEFKAPLVDAPTELVFGLRVIEGEFLSVEDTITITAVPTGGEGEPQDNDCRSAPFVEALEVLREGRLDGPHDVDYIRLFIRDGMTFSIETQPVGGAFTDTTLGLARLRDGDVFDLRTADDDGGLFVMSRLEGFFGGDGTICVMVSGHGDIRYFDGSFHEVEGDYLLRVALGAPPGNRPPIVEVPSQRLVEPGATLTLDGGGSSDPDGDPITFAWAQIAGPAVEMEGVDGSALTLTVPSALDEETNFRFRLRVSDPYASSEGAVDVIVRSNNAPSLAPVEAIAVVEGELVAFTLSAADPDGDDLNFGIEAAPSGALVDPATGQFSWQTGIGDAGAADIRVFAEDSFGARAVQRVEVVVEPAQNLPPQIAPMAPRVVEALGVSTEVTLTAEVTDPEGQPLALSWTRADAAEVVLGEGAELRVSLEVGAHAFVLSASDGVNEARAEALVLVLDDTLRPVAVVGGAQRVAMPLEAQAPAAYIDGRQSSDPLSRPLVFVWEAVDPVEGFEVAEHPGASSVGVLQVVEPGAQEVAVTIRLTVVAQDEDFGDIPSAASETIVRLIPGGNALPEAVIEGPDRAAQGETHAFDSAASVDPEGQPLRLAWSLTRGQGEILAPGSPSTEVTFGEPRDPTPVGWTVALLVNDGQANGAPALHLVRRAAPGPVDPPDVEGEPDAEEPDAGDVPSIRSPPPGSDCVCSALAGPARVGAPWWAIFGLAAGLARLRIRRRGQGDPV